MLFCWIIKVWVIKVFKGLLYWHLWHRAIFIDKRDFERPLYEQIEEAYEFVLKYINLGAEISGLIRTDAYELPTEATREAIVNATTHRNFLDRACAGSSI